MALVSSTVGVGRSAFLSDEKWSTCSQVALLQPSCRGRVVLPRITAAIKRKKDYALDDVIQREKKLKLVTKVKNLIVRQPGMVMSLIDMGKYRRHIGLPGKHRLVALLNKFPAVFRVFEEGADSIYCRLTYTAEAQYKEEVELRKQLEDVLVLRLRKLLMMSVDRRILLIKIVHLRNDLGLPADFVDSILPRYPEFFEVVDTELGPALELKKWDPELAVTYDSLKAARQNYDDITVSGRVPKFPVFSFQKGLKVSRRDKFSLVKFYEAPLVSPYEDASHLHPSSVEAERRAVALVQELLHLTVEKRTLVDHLTHFRSDFRFSQQLRGMLIRHPEVFYVSLKGIRNSVFLREAYNDNSELIVKDPLVLAKEKLDTLIRLGNNALKISEDYESSEEDDGSWSDEEKSESLAYLQEKQRQKELAIARRPKVEPW